MIYKKDANNIVDAATYVTEQLLRENRPTKPVIIKPNLVEPSSPPTTTDVRVVKGIIKALRDSGIDDIAVAEGSGTGDTTENFIQLGYSQLNAKLIDLDNEKTITLPVDNHHVWNEISLPEILLNKFIISSPVLKDHSMCGVTISLKNMIGILPEKYYGGFWTFKKSLVHKYDTHGCIADIVQIMPPHWAIVDATIGMKGSHLSGTPFNPPLNLVYGSSDPLEADSHGCELLGKKWNDIRYLRLISEKKLGGSRQKNELSK